MTPPSLVPGNRTERSRSAHAVPRPQSPELSTAAIVAGVIALACVAVTAIALFGHPSVSALRWVLAGVTCGALVVLALAFMRPRVGARASGYADDGLRAARHNEFQANRQDELRAARQVVQRGQAELQQMIDRVMRGEHPGQLAPAPARVTDGDPFRLLLSEIEQAQYQAAQAVLRAAERASAESKADHRVEIFVNLARRMQSLVHREIELLDGLEAKVEDPDLLKGLFTVDHLATRLRRQSESLAVLGGSSSRRQWTRQVTMHEVLRAAVAEVEQYSRVKVVPPVEGVLRGAAVADVIHLTAELVENATKFSAPHTIVLLRAQHVTAGVAIEVEDRGLGMLAADQQRMNDVLADPTRMDVEELLRDGRIGLYVVATLGRRHNIRVQLQNNIFGGTQAVMVLPKTLLDAADEPHALPAAAPEGRISNPQPALQSAGATMAAPSAAPTAARAGISNGAAASGPAGGAARSPAGGTDNGAAGWAASDRSAWVPGDQGPAPLPSRRPVVPGTFGSPASQATDRDALGDRGPLSERGSFTARGSLDDYGARDHGAASNQSAIGDRDRGPVGAPQNGDRPPLPKRQGQASVAPTTAQNRWDPAARNMEPPAEQMSGLMADFLRGVRSAEEEDPPARDY